MTKTLQEGLEFGFVYEVPPTKTVPHLFPEFTEGGEMPEVFATGYMVGLFEFACIKAINEGWVPPTAGLDEADPDCDLDYVPNVGRDLEVNYAMSNSFAFGGLNAVLVFGKPPA